MEKEMISQRKATILVIFVAVVCIIGTYLATSEVVGSREYEAGVEGGKGQIRDAMVGDIYELKLVGIKDGRAYELEGSYGLSINGQPDAKRIPSDARAGDSVACIRHEKGLEIVSRRQ